MQKENFAETYAKGEEPSRAAGRATRCAASSSSSAAGAPGSSCRWCCHRARRRRPQAHVPHARDGSVYGLQIWLKAHVSRYFESTLLQELEWHLHTALFALVLGFGTIYNTHVRVDLVRDHVSFRKKIWIEFLGLSCFMIPYLLLVICFASSWVFDSYKLGEISASTVGLSHRWIIKGILVFGLIVATIAGIAVWLQVALLMWGDAAKRFQLMTLEWPEEAGTRIEGKERIMLESDDPRPAVLEAPSRRFAVSRKA